MLASRQFSYWPGLPVWHNSGAHNTCNTPSTLPKNPFSRRSDAERVIAEAQYTEDYHIFQLSCYTQSPTREAVKTAAAGNNACRRETTPCPMSRVRSLLLVPFSMMETAKTLTQTVRSSTSSVVDQVRDKIDAWWLSSRELRLCLLRLVISILMVFASATMVRQLKTTESSHGYVLVHVCQSWSVYQGQ